MKNAQETLLRHYLLGALPEAEQAALEARYFAEAAQLEEVWAVENQLVDDYVRGRLARAERAQFEQYYLDSPRHRERVATAQMLLRAADAAAEPAPSFWETFWAALRGPQLVLGLSFAVLVLLAGGVWFLTERARWREELAATQAQLQERERALTAQIAGERAQNEQLAAELAQRESARQTTQPPEAARPAPTPGQSSVFAFLLVPTLLRSGSGPQPLRIPENAGQVELRMRLESADYPAYQIHLRTVEGASVWNRQNLKARAGRIGVTVPAAKLPAGDYFLTLSGVSATNEVEEVNRYFFRVSSK